MNNELRWIAVATQEKGAEREVLEKMMEPGAGRRGLRGAEERKQEKKKLRRLGLYSCRGGGVATVMAAGWEEGREGEKMEGEEEGVEIDT